MHLDNAMDIHQDYIIGLYAELFAWDIGTLNLNHCLSASCESGKRTISDGMAKEASKLKAICKAK